jgi:hypothetical protein
MYKPIRIPMEAYQNICLKQDRIFKDLKMFKPNISKGQVPLTKVLTFITSKELTIPYTDLQRYFLEKRNENWAI